MDCYCDYDPPAWHRSSRPRAKRRHRCDECDAPILPGQIYENVVGKWESSISTFKTCPACLMLRDAASISFPCFKQCWAHGNMLEDLATYIQEEAWKVGGLRFEFGRRYVKARRMREEARQMGAA